jgi:tripartite-type tricarboxylate transporter receptor subunit TctC
MTQRAASAAGNGLTSRRRLTRAVAALLLGVVVAPIAAQQAWPTQAIRIVVPYAPGGSADAFARHFGEQLARELGQGVIIDNRPGASTNIGATAVVRARPDGYTLLLGSLQQVLSPVFGPDPGFELLTSFEPVSLMARLPFVVAAHPTMPFNDARALVAAAKAAPGTLSISSAQLDMFVELLNSKAGVKLLNVPYKGGAPATTDAISGQVNMVYAGVPVLLPHIQAGKLKALAVTTASRVASLPDVPTFVESGVDYDVVAWYGLLAPAGTPKPVVERLARATTSIMTRSEMVQKVRASGLEPATSRPEELQQLLRKDLALWQGVARSAPSLVQK